MTDHVTDEQLMEAAQNAAKSAYAPYSHFRVGAAVVDSAGNVFIGCNVENAAYGSTVCAEVNAISTAVAAGSTHLKSIAVAALDGTDVYPCGNCRQVFREFGVGEVIIDGSSGLVKHTLDNLLPKSFGPEHLG